MFGIDRRRNYWRNGLVPSLGGFAGSLMQRAYNNMPSYLAPGRYGRLNAPANRGRRVYKTRRSDPMVSLSKKRKSKPSFKRNKRRRVAKKRSSLTLAKLTNIMAAPKTCIWDAKEYLTGNSDTAKYYYTPANTVGFTGALYDHVSNVNRVDVADVTVGAQDGYTNDYVPIKLLLQKWSSEYQLMNTSLGDVKVTVYKFRPRATGLEGGYFGSLGNMLSNVQYADEGADAVSPATLCTKPDYAFHENEFIKRRAKLLSKKVHYMKAGGILRIYDSMLTPHIIYADDITASAINQFVLFPWATLVVFKVEGCLGSYHDAGVNKTAHFPVNVCIDVSTKLLWKQPNDHHKHIFDDRDDVIQSKVVGDFEVFGDTIIQADAI